MTNSGCVNSKLTHPGFVCRHGVIVYRALLPVGALIGGGLLDLWEPVHDYAQVSSLIEQH